MKVLVIVAVALVLAVAARVCYNVGVQVGANEIRIQKGI